MVAVAVAFGPEPAAVNVYVVFVVGTTFLLPLPHGVLGAHEEVLGLV
jgi:hypothetical protein